MKNKYLIIIFSLIALSSLTLSCKKVNEPDDKDKIDIKGSLMNGDMKNPNIEVLWKERSVWIWFYNDLGACTINIRSRNNSIVVCDTIDTYYNASYRYYMGDQPLDRYFLVISNGTDEAEGWFYNFRLSAARPK